MTYETALALKDAGFPLKKVSAPSDWDGNSIFFDGTTTLGGNKRAYLIPTLEELIEACGDEFMSINQNRDNATRKIVKGSKQFWATGLTGIRANHEEGATPSEAAARLWINLHKK